MSHSHTFDLTAEDYGQEQVSPEPQENVEKLGSIEENENEPEVNAQDVENKNGDPEDTPRYSQSIDVQPLEDLPPAFRDSWTGRLRARRKMGEGLALKDVFSYFMATVGWIIVLIIALPLALGIPISMIVMGSMHLDDCPAERLIPFYLLTGGVVSLTRNIIYMLRKVFCSESNSSILHVDVVLDIFLFAWFIAGNVWVYRTRDAFSDDPQAADFCDPTLYWFSFWIITAVYILVGVSFVLALVVACVAAWVALASD